MPKIEINLTNEEHKNLAALALARGLTVEQCVKAFARSCQPNGSGWKHPTANSRRIPEIHNDSHDPWSKPSKSAIDVARKRMKESLSR